MLTHLDAVARLLDRDDRESDPKDPAAHEGTDIASTRRAQSFPQSRRLAVAVRVLSEVRRDTAYKDVRTERRAEHLQDRSTLGVADAIEDLIDACLVVRRLLNRM